MIHTEHKLHSSTLAT